MTGQGGFSAACLAGISHQGRKGGALQAAKKGVAAALRRQVGIAIIEVMAT
jgi:hypothetical protein